MQAVNETGLTPSQLLDWGWRIAKFEIVQSMVEAEILVYEAS